MSNETRYYTPDFHQRMRDGSLHFVASVPDDKYDPGTILFYLDDDGTVWVEERSGREEKYPDQDSTHLRKYRQVKDVPAEVKRARENVGRLDKTMSFEIGRRRDLPSWILAIAEALGTRQQMYYQKKGRKVRRLANLAGMPGFGSIYHVLLIADNGEVWEEFGVGRKTLRPAPPDRLRTIAGMVQDHIDKLGGKVDSNREALEILSQLEDGKLFYHKQNERGRDRILSITQVEGVGANGGNLADEKRDGRRYDGFKVQTERQVILLLIESGQMCCEIWGYFMSEDSPDYFVGADLIDVKITDEALNEAKMAEEGAYEGSVMFVDLVTDRGVLQFVAYNDHNGCYGHDALVKSIQVEHTTTL